MIPVELTERAEEARIRCWCGYGLTELLPRCALKARRCAARALACRSAAARSNWWTKKLDPRRELALGYWRYGHLQPLAR